MKELKVSISYPFLECLRFSAEEVGIMPVQYAVHLLCNSLFSESEDVDETYEESAICTDSSADSIELVLPLSDDLYSELAEKDEDPGRFAKECIAQELGYEEDPEDDGSLESIGYTEEELLMEFFGVSTKCELEDALDSYRAD